MAKYSIKERNKYFDAKQDDGKLKYNLIVNKKYREMEENFINKFKTNLFEATGQKGKLLPRNRAAEK